MDLPPSRSHLHLSGLYPPSNLIYSDLIASLTLFVRFSLPHLIRSTSRPPSLNCRVCASCSLSRVPPQRLRLTPARHRAPAPRLVPLILFGHPSSSPTPPTSSITTAKICSPDDCARSADSHSEHKASPLPRNSPSLAFPCQLLSRCASTRSPSNRNCYSI